MSRSNVSQRKITSREEGKKLDELAEEILELYKADTLDEVMKKINSKHNLNARSVLLLDNIDNILSDD